MKNKLIQAAFIAAVLIGILIVSAGLRFASLYLYQNYGVEIEHTYLVGTIVILYIGWKLAEAHEEIRVYNAIDTPDVMNVEYKPMTRVVYEGDKYSTWIMECNYELDIPIGTVFEHGHFKYRVTHFHPFCSGEGRVYYTKKL